MLLFHIGFTGEIGAARISQKAPAAPALHHCPTGTDSFRLSVLGQRNIFAMEIRAS